MILLGVFLVRQDLHSREDQHVLVDPSLVADMFPAPQNVAAMTALIYVTAPQKMSRLSWKWRERSSVKINGEEACEKDESTTRGKRR
jgi:hypothetical protein